jgi:hypothetical protein
MKNYVLSAALFFSLTTTSTNNAMVIMGSHWTKSYEGELPLTCVICHNENLKVYSMRRWFTLFFIDTYPTSDKDYYLECLACENCYKLKGLDIEQLLAAAKKA